MIEAIRSTEPNATQFSDSTTTSEPKSAGRQLIITRIIDAPRGLVFKGWTEGMEAGWTQSLERLEAYVAA